MTRPWDDPRQVLPKIRCHLRLIDVSIAVLLTAGGLSTLAQVHFSGSVGIAVLSSCTCTGSVAIRRVAPQTAMILAIFSGALYQSVTSDPQGAFESAALALVGYMFGRSVLRTGRHLQGALLLGYAFAVLEIMPRVWHQSHLASISGIWLTVVLLPTATGALVERRAQVTAKLAAAVKRLHDEERIQFERATAEERNRVARELHDVVAHHLSVMVIQAGAARTVANRLDAAATALRTVTESGREALTDLRRITGVLRRNDDQWVGFPPRLDQLDLLVARTRAAGVTASLHIVGNPGKVPPALDLAAYRIIQEALTNVVKHAATTTASIEVNIGENALTLSVTNDGTDRSTPRLGLPSSGQGLVGMRERVDLYGGQIETGRTSSGGFNVRASIPLRASISAKSEIAKVKTGKLPSHGIIATAVRLHMDVFLAGAWLIVLMVDAFTSRYRHGSLTLNVVVVAAMAGACIWRRRRPLLFLVVIGGLAVLLNGGLDTLRTATFTGIFILVVPVYTVAVWGSRVSAVSGLLVWEAGMVAIGFTSHAPGAALAGAAMMGGIVWVAGRVTHSYRILCRELAATMWHLKTEASQRELLAVANQRAVIAQDLNRLVAGHVVTMIVQSQAAQTHRSLEEIRDAASVIEETGREALARMRDILGILRVHHMPRSQSSWSNGNGHSDTGRMIRPIGRVSLGAKTG